MSLVNLANVLCSRIVHYLTTAPRGALSVTGILGLALVVYGYLQLRNREDSERRNRAGQAVPGAQGAPGAAAASEQRPATAPPASAPASNKTQSQALAPAVSATPVGRAVASQLSGAKRVTVSLPGVLFEEHTPQQLQDSANIRQDAVEVVREMCRMSDVYFIAHVEDDVGEAVVTGALEAAGLLGTAPGQVVPHHVLCCGTLEGKVPIVRQLEPDLHMDAHVATVDELRRFLPRLALVRQGSGTAGSGSANVGVVDSLPAYFGL